MARFERLPELLKDFERGVSVAKLGKKYHLSRKSLFRFLIEARRKGQISRKSLARALVAEDGPDFPKHPEARLETLLRCMNGEIKQAIMLVVDDDPMTGTGIRNCLAEFTRSFLPGDGTFRDYCVQTLAPAGLLVHQLFGTHWGRRYSCYSLSKAGKEYGQPVAAFSLRYAVDRNVSLYELFGPSFSNGISLSPHNRARIIELVAEGYSQIIELEEQIGLSHTDINYHLKHLQARGLVRVDSLRSQPGMKTYHWVKGRRPEEAKTVNTRRQLTSAVAQWLYSHKAGNLHQIAPAVSYHHLSDISQVLVGLSRQGLAQTRFPSSHRSAVEPGPRGRLMLDYLRAVRLALKDRARLREMAGLVHQFRADRKLFTTYLDAAVDLYRAAAPGFNRRGSKNREAELMRLVETFQEEYGKGPRPSQMAKSLRWNHGTLTIYLNSLIRQGRLIKQQEKTGVRYVPRR